MIDVSNNDNTPITGTVELGKQILFYKEIGFGEKIVLAFHGYGNDSSMFRFLHHPNYTVICFDLPFQGKSVGNKNQKITKDDLSQLVFHFLKTKKVRKIGLVGFSLGCRLCLCIAEKNPEHISTITLIAPDGLVHNKFFHFLTKTKIGDFLFKNFLSNGNPYLSLITIFNKIKFISNSKYKFAVQYTNTQEARELLYDIWKSTSLLVPNIKLVKRNIYKRKLPVHIHVGKKDRIIPYKNALKFIGKSQQIKLHLYERGHNLLNFEDVRGIVKAWLFRTYTSGTK